MQQSLGVIAAFLFPGTLLHQKTVLVICGPTAVGKTALAISLAAELRTEIISADSRQCYKELDIGVAKPSPAQLAEIPHHFINSHSITDEVNAAVFEQYALSNANKLFEQYDTIVMVGGTGLYIKAFTDGLDIMPEIPLQIRDNVQSSYNQHGLTWLQEQVQAKDPGFWQTAEQQNPRRLMRALEVVLATSSSFLSFKTGTTLDRPFNVIKVGLELPRPELYNRINTRVDEMIHSGLINEVKSLINYSHLKSLQTVGYTELFDMFNGAYNQQQAVEKIKTNTRQYAKRQMTWFKKDADVQWFAAGDDALESILKLLKQST